MFPQPKRHKKDVSENNFHPFPIDNIVREQDYNYSGYFTGINVEIFEEESVKAIYENGSFGIGSKTRAAPKVLWKGDIAPSKVLKKIYEKKCEWREQIGGYGGNISIDVIQENATDQHPEDDTKKSLRIDPFHIEETLVLTLEESFFLHSTLKCLRIMDVNGKEMQTNDILLKYCSLKPNFWTHFVAYLYLRSKNWIVKCGLKFGGDYRKYYSFLAICFFVVPYLQIVESFFYFTKQCFTRKVQGTIMQAISF